MDLRVIKTRDSLNKALVELLRDKPLTKIRDKSSPGWLDPHSPTTYYRNPYVITISEQTLYQEFAD